MPLSEGSERDAWANLRRQPHMSDLELMLLSVMAEAATAQPVVPLQQSPVQPPPWFDVLPLGGTGSETLEGALTDLETVAEGTDVALTIDGDLFAVFGLQMEKAHLLALIRVWNAFQASQDDSEVERLGQQLWNFLTLVLEGLYHSMVEGQ